MATKKRKVGRPALPKGKAKAAITPIRLKNDERAVLARAARQAGVSLSEWIRHRVHLGYAHPEDEPLPRTKEPGAFAVELGAFVLIDCLGFKESWNQGDDTTRSLIHKLYKIEEIADDIPSDSEFDPNFNVISSPPLTGLNADMVPHVRLLSDTVAISVKWKSSDRPKNSVEDGRLIDKACELAREIMKLFLEEEPLLSMRGCVTYGKHIATGNFIVGPAVRDAAEHYELANGAFVWLRPSAEEMHRAYHALRRTPIDLRYPRIIDGYEMPLKSGARLRCSVVNPFGLEPSAKNRNTILKSYRHAMKGDRLDICLKRQNTFDFLEVAMTKTAEYTNAISVKAGLTEGNPIAARPEAS